MDAVGVADSTTRQTVGDAWQARVKAAGSETAAGTWETDVGRMHTREPSDACSQSVRLSQQVAQLLLKNQRWGHEAL